MNLVEKYGPISWERVELMPWYRRPPAWFGAGMKPLPRVYIFAGH